MSHKSNFGKQILYSGLAFGVIALLFGLWSHHNVHNSSTPKELTLKSGTALPIARDIKPFELKNAPNGTPFTNTQLKGHWSMLFFGFTSCQMLCPTTLTTLNHFYGTLEAANIKELPQVIFVSIDPERDTLQRIHQYVTAFNKNFRGATGTDAQLDQVTNEFNILYTKVNPKDKDYQIDHSGTVLLINPEGHLQALFSPPFNAQALSEDYQTIIKEASKEK